MRRRSVILTIIVVTVIFAFFFSSHAAEKKMRLPKDKTPTTRPLPGGERRVTIAPDIREFSCSDGIEFYRMAPFGGITRPHVNIQVADLRGLESVEITFRGNRVYYERLAAHPIRWTKRALELDIYPYRPSRSGTYALEATAVNILGAADRRSLNINVDVQIPRIRSFHPTGGETIYADFRHADITWEIDATDEFSGIERVRVVGNLVGKAGIRWEGSDTTAPYRITIRDVELGSSDWVIDVRDNAGTLNNRMVRIRVVPRPFRKR